MKSLLERCTKWFNRTHARSGTLWEERYKSVIVEDGAVMGGKEFVNEVIIRARDRFGPKRKDGTRKLRGGGSAAAGLIWSARDLRVRNLTDAHDKSAP